MKTLAKVSIAPTLLNGPHGIRINL